MFNTQAPPLLSQIRLIRTLSHGRAGVHVLVYPALSRTIQHSATSNNISYLIRLIFLLNFR
jgi:hypothetical protein